MIAPELLSLIGGGATGFLFRYMAQKAQDQKELFEQMMAANQQTTDNQNTAAERVPLDVGKFVRQLIVLSVLFGSILAPRPGRPVQSLQRGPASTTCSRSSSTRALRSISGFASRGA